MCQAEFLLKQKRCEMTSDNTFSSGASLSVRPPPAARRASFGMVTFVQWLCSYGVLFLVFYAFASPVVRGRRLRFHLAERHLATRFPVHATQLRLQLKQDQISLYTWVCRILYIWLAAVSCYHLPLVRAPLVPTCMP